jgi:hypothetical protein
MNLSRKDHESLIEAYRLLFADITRHHPRPSPLLLALAPHQGSYRLNNAIVRICSVLLRDTDEVAVSAFAAALARHYRHPGLPPKQLRALLVLADRDEDLAFAAFHRIDIQVGLNGIGTCNHRGINYSFGAKAEEWFLHISPAISRVAPTLAEAIRMSPY